MPAGAYSLDTLSYCRAMESAVYLLIGFPGAGKYTVARALAEHVNSHGGQARVVDNHYVNNPVFGVLSLDGETALPAAVWPLVEQVRDAVLTAIEQFSPPSWSFVFTNYITAEEAASTQLVADYLERLQQVALARGTSLRVVRLTCELEELTRRVANEERRQRLKTTSARWVREAVATCSLFDPKTENVLTLDISSLPPAQAARQIATHGWSSNPSHPVE